MSHKCELKEQSPQATVGIRTRTTDQDLPNVLGEAYGQIMQYLGEKGVYPAGPPFVAYYNDDMQDLDIEAGFPVAEELPGEGDIQAGEIPGGKMATCFYTGPYEEFEAPYTALTQWVQEHDYETTGVSYEMYLNDPQDTPPEKLQTLIMFPLK